MTRRALLFGLVTAAVLVAQDGAHGKPHRWVDEQGNVHYSDQPPPGTAKPVEQASPPAGRPREPIRPEPAREPVPAPRPAPAPPASPEPSDPPAVSSALPSEPERPEVVAPGIPVREIMNLSGLDHWIDYLANSARGEFGRYRWRISQPDAAWAALTQAFRRDALAATAAQVLLRTVEPDDVAPMLAWLRAPLSRKITELQAELTAPTRQQEYRTFVSKLPDAPPPSARIALIQRLERERQVAQFQVEMPRAVRASMARVLSPLKTSTGRFRNGEEDDTRPRNEEWARFYAVTMMLFAYRSLTDEELAEDAQFSESPLGVRWLKIYEESLREALRIAEQRAAAALRGPTARRAE
jgi:hypothetical protein